MNAGKGDKPRPVDKKLFDKNFEQINWQKKDSSNLVRTVKKGKISFSYR